MTKGPYSKALGDRRQKWLGKAPTVDYSLSKFWGVNTEEYAAFSGEVGKYVPVLDDRSDMKGTRIKLLCRLSFLHFRTVRQGGDATVATYC